MARIDESSFKGYIDGRDRMTAIEYMRDREILRLAINDQDDRIKSVGEERIQELATNIGIIGNEATRAIKTINGIEPVDGNIEIEIGGGGGGGDISAQPLGSEPVQLGVPVDVRNLHYIPGDTTIKLNWNESVSSDVAKYSIYRNGTKVGETTTPSYSMTGLTKNTLYSIRVTASSVNGESLGSTIEAKTNGNVGLIMNQNNNRVLLNGVDFDTIEFDLILNPMVDSWGNVLLSMPGVERLVSSQYAGANDWFIDGDDIYPSKIYLNGVETGNRWGDFVVTKNTRVKLAFDIPFTGKRNFIVFANGDLYSTLKGTIFTITLLKVQEDGEVRPAAIYDFTYAGPVNVPDLLGKSTEAIIIGGTFG